MGRLPRPQCGCVDGIRNGWAGAYGTSCAVNPRDRMVLVFTVQRLPTRSNLAERFPMLVYLPLVEPNR